MNTYEIYDDEMLAAFGLGAHDPALLALVERLVTRARAQGHWQSTCIVVGEPLALLGFDPVTDAPDWAWRREHDGWVELGLILDEFTWVLLVPSGSELAQRT